MTGTVPKPTDVRDAAPDALAPRDRPRHAPGTLGAPGAPATDDAAWAAAFGARWRWYLVLLGALLFAVGALAPLSDIDLPMHLALGEWIARHHALPTVEPFAWTRAGAPYYAYSWLADLSYYALLRAFGSVALHALHGLTMLAAGAAVYRLGRVAGWRPWTTALVVALGAFVASTIVATLRPQAVLFVSVPLAWACVERILADEARGDGLRWPPLAGLAAACALAANVHLLFPLTGAPLALLLARPARRLKTVAATGLAVVAGWACNPYALDYGAIYRLNFEPNALFTAPSPVAEFSPGFALFSLHSPVALVVVLLAALPWAMGPATLSRRERVVFGMLWLVGLVGFALRVRALAIWWLVMLPVVARLADRLPQPTVAVAIGRMQRLALAAIVALLALRAGAHAPMRWREEGGVARRRLPTPAGPAVEPLARWLEANARPGARGRALTTFNIGSYLAWRLPQYSESIDGRTIFPDSAARPEAIRVASDGPLPLGPWRSADLAIVPLRFPVAAVLDTATGWRRVATADSSAAVPISTGLWVRDAWWRSAERTARPAPLPTREGPR